MYKTPKFYGPQLLYQMVKVHFYFFTGKVLLLESYHKIMEVFPWIFRIYPSNFKSLVIILCHMLHVLQQSVVYRTYMYICIISDESVSRHVWYLEEARVRVESTHSVVAHRFSGKLSTQALMHQTTLQLSFWAPKPTCLWRYCWQISVIIVGTRKSYDCDRCM